MNECKILLVDDDPEDHIIMQEAMAEVHAEGYMQFTTNGYLALDILSCTGDDRLPQLIVLDLNMPLISGTETLQLLKKEERLKNIPVIVFSTSANPVEKEKCMQLGAHAYLIKPHSNKQTIEMARLFLEFCAAKVHN